MRKRKNNDSIELSMKLRKLVFIFLFALCPSRGVSQSPMEIEIDLKKTSQENQIVNPEKISLQNGLNIRLKNYQKGSSINIMIGDILIDESRIDTFRVDTTDTAHIIPIGNTGIIEKLEKPNRITLPFKLEVIYKSSPVLKEIAIGPKETAPKTSINSPDLLDRLTMIGIVLLILSLITEKITNLFRKYFPHLNTILKFILKQISKLLSRLPVFLGKLKKAYDRIIKWINQYNESIEPDQSSGRKQERDVMLFSIFIGIIVTVISNADIYSLFKFLKSSNGAEFSNYLFVPFKTEGEANWLAKSLSILFTGFFLSFGSKFFHDLVDLLLQVKNYRRKLNDPTTYESPNIQTLRKYLEVAEEEIVSQALLEHQVEWLSLKNVIGIGISKTEKGEKCIEVQVKKLPDSSIPDSVTVKVASGLLKSVPVIIRQMQQAEAHQAITITPSEKVAHRDPQDSLSGTLSGIVKRKKSETELFLTCYHVVKGKRQSYDEFNINSSDRIENANGQVIGHLIEGRRDLEIDAALIKPDLSVSISPKIKGLNIKPAGRRTVSSLDENKTKVKIYGVTSQLREGTIVHATEHKKISYWPKRRANEWTLFNLFSIKPDDDKPFSKGGDSGALVLDQKDNCALGIIVAGNDEFSYAIPLETVCEKLEVELA